LTLSACPESAILFAIGIQNASALSAILQCDSQTELASLHPEQTRNTGDEVTKPNSAFERVKVDPLADSGSATIDQGMARERGALQVMATAFLVLFCIVGLALWGLPFYYDFMVQQFGWTRAQVTSGNALSKLVVGPVFGFLAGWMVDRFGPRRLMMAGILMAGTALIGLGGIATLGMFYFFYLFNALGYVWRPAAKSGAAVALVR